MMFALAPREWARWVGLSLVLSLITMALTFLNVILLSHINLLTDSIALSFATVFVLTLSFYLLNFEHEKQYLYLQLKNTVTVLKQNFQKVIQTEPEKLSALPSGELAQSFSDFERGLSLLSDAGLNLLQSFIPFVGLIFYIFICFPAYISTLFAMLTITFTVKLALLLLRFAFAKQLLKHQASMMTWFTECVQQISIIRLFNAMQPTFEKGIGLLFQLQRLYRKIQMQQIAIMLWDYFFIAIMTLFIYMRQDIRDMPLLFLATQLGMYLDRVTTNITQSLQARESIHRLTPVLKVSQPKEAHLITNIPKNYILHCENLAYQAPGTTVDIFKNVNLSIHPGEFVALVGESGVGKSSLLRLLLGLMQPTRGYVRINQVNLTNFDLTAWRQSLGVVLQNSQLLNESIYANIAGNTSLSVDEVWALAEAVGLAEDIRAMPMGLFTRMSDQPGAFVSGGQKQKVLLARALAKKPTCLVLDEATSALDNTSQAVIHNTLKSLSITRIVVAHRISTIANADAVYQLTPGGLECLK